MHPALLLLGALGGLALLGSKKREEGEDLIHDLPSTVTSPPVPSPHPPSPEPPSAPVSDPVPPNPPSPPLTIQPGGRRLSALEMAVLAPYISREDLDSAILWWGRPASSFKSEDPDVDVQAVTTSHGIYLRPQNHAIVTPEEFAMVAHELFHVGQFRRGEIHEGDPPEDELPAYQLQLTVMHDLNEQSWFDGRVPDAVPGLREYLIRHQENQPTRAV